MALENKSVPVTFQGGQQSGTNPQTIGESSFTSLENSISRRIGEYEKVPGNTQLSTSMVIDGQQKSSLINRSQFLTPGEGNSVTLWTSNNAIPKDVVSGNWLGTSFVSGPVMGLNRTSLEPRVTSEALLNYTYVQNATGTRAVEVGFKQRVSDYRVSIRVINPTTKVVYGETEVNVSLPSVDANTFAGVQFSRGAETEFNIGLIVPGTNTLNVYQYSSVTAPTFTEVNVLTYTNVTKAKLLPVFTSAPASARAIFAYSFGTGTNIRIIYNDNTSATGDIGYTITSGTVFKDATVSLATGRIYLAFFNAGNIYLGAYFPLNLSGAPAPFLVDKASSVNSDVDMRIVAGTLNALEGKVNAGNNIALYQLFDGEFRLQVGLESTGGFSSPIISGAFLTCFWYSRDVASSVTSAQDCVPVSNAGIVNGQPILLVATSKAVSVNSAYFLVSYHVISKILGGKAVGFKAVPDIAYPYTTVNVLNAQARIGVTYVQDVRRLSTGISTYPDGTRQIGQGIYLEYTSGSAIATFEFSPEAFPVIETSEEYLIGSGVVLSYPKTFAGAAPVESTILVTPDITNILTDAGSLTSGAYAFAITFEASDRIGRIYKSAPAGPSSVTLTVDSKKIIIEFLQSGFTYFTALTPVLYMTERNGTILYRTALTSTKIDGSSTAKFEVVAVPANLTEGEIIYTEGGVVPNVAAECVTSLVEHKGRVFAGTASPGITYTYSKDKTLNEPYNFCFDTFISSEAVGSIVALSSFDDKLLVHTDTDAYYVAGDGPSDTGAGNNLSTLIRLPYAAGVINCNAISVMSDQIIYVSKRGLVSMDRSLAVTPILAMQSVDMSSTTSMVYRPNQNELWIGTSAAGTVIYNHFTQTWSRLPTLNSLHAVVSGNLYTRLTTASGTVYQETPAAYTLDGGANSQRLETAWIAMTGIEGYQRVFSFNMLGQIVTNPVTVYIDLYYNYDNATLVETVPYTHTGAATQIRVIPKIQKCTAIKLVIRESSTTAGFKFTGLQFEVGVKTGLYRAPR